MVEAPLEALEQDRLAMRLSNPSEKVTAVLSVSVPLQDQEFLREYCRHHDMCFAQSSGSGRSEELICASRDGSSELTCDHDHPNRFLANCKRFSCAELLKTVIKKVTNKAETVELSRMINRNAEKRFDKPTPDSGEECHCFGCCSAASMLIAL